MEIKDKRRRGINNYIFKEDFVILQVLKDGIVKEILIDYDDYEKIESYWWTLPTCGYPRATRKTKIIKLSRFIMDICDPDIKVDHINHNPLDNRKCNLRFCTQHQNTTNKGISSNNTSGIIGVTFYKKYNRWRCRLMYKGNEIISCLFQTSEEAIKTRLKAELEYFGEFAPQKHLFEQYGIEV